MIIWGVCDLVEMVYRPKDILDALEFLRVYGSETAPLAGGTDLIIALKERKIRPRFILDLTPLKSELSYVKIDKNIVKIGALTTVWELSKSILHTDYRFAAFKDLWHRFGTMVLRFEATIGGNIASATRYNDYITLLLAYDARVKTISINSEREQYLENFIISSGKTNLQSTELIKEIIFEIPGENCSGAFFKLDRRKALMVGFMNSAIYMCINRDDKITDLKIAYNMPKGKEVPGRLRDIENSLLNRRYDVDYINSLAEQLAKFYVDARTSWHAKGEYRVHLAKVAFQRSLKLIRERILSRRYIKWEDIIP